jgi:hypothetical protein
MNVTNARLIYKMAYCLSFLLLATLLCRAAFCGEIHDAVKSGDLEKVKTLLKTNPDLVFSKGQGGWTPLHYAAKSGNKDVVEFLLEHKAEVNAEDNYGQTPLFLARNRNPDIAALLRQHGGEEKVLTPEEKSWSQVDSLNKQSLEEFLKNYPDGKLAPAAKVAIEIQNDIASIKENKIKPDLIIPFGTLGERWKTWQSRRPDKGVSGYMRQATGAIGCFMAKPLRGGKTPGLDTMSFDNYGDITISPTGSGSIIAFRTVGNAFPFLNGVKIESQDGEPVYFVVIAEKGLVHIKGAGTVTTPDGKTTELK